MADLSERHEVRVRSTDNTIVFVADSSDGKLVIRQETEGDEAHVCSITIADPGELRDFFLGLRRILASLGHEPAAGATGAEEKADGRSPAAGRRDGSAGRQV